MHLRRRLERLEYLERGGETDEDREEHVRREALTRVTDEDLALVWGYLERTEEEEGSLRRRSGRQSSVTSNLKRR